MTGIYNMRYFESVLNEQLPASLIRSELRPTDVFARLGTPFHYDSTTRPFSAFSGLATANAGDTPENLERRADEALYEAKRAGRGRWVKSS